MFLQLEVRTDPMFTLFTRMFSGPSSMARALLREMHAARLTEVANSFGSGDFPRMALMLTMVRPPGPACGGASGG
jgi:hypothetical protein